MSKKRPVIQSDSEESDGSDNLNKVAVQQESRLLKVREALKFLKGMTVGSHTNVYMLKRSIVFPPKVCTYPPDSRVDLTIICTTVSVWSGVGVG